MDENSLRVNKETINKYLSTSIIKRIEDHLRWSDFFSYLLILLFFNPEIKKVKSPDGEETLLYPTKGFLRMDGLVGASKPRLLLLLMPFIFLTYYLASFYYTLTTIF